MTDSGLELTRAIGRRLCAARPERALSLSQLVVLTGGLYSKSRLSNYERVRRTRASSGCLDSERGRESVGSRRRSGQCPMDALITRGPCS